MGSANVTITAVFELRKYNISFSIEDANFGDVYILSGSNELASTNASNTTASTTATMGTELTVKIVPQYYSKLNVNNMPEGLGEPMTEETDTGMYYMGTYVVGTSDYNAVIPLTLCENEEENIILRQDDQDPNNSDVLLLYDSKGGDFYVYAGTDGQVIRGLSCVQHLDGLSVKCNVMSDSSGTGAQYAIPIYLDNNGTRMYFKQLISNGSSYYFVDFGEGFICEPVPNSDTYNGTSDHLYLIYTGSNSDMPWTFSKVAPN